MEVAKLAAPPNLEVRFVSCNESAIKRWLSSELEETVFSLTHELFMNQHHTVTLRNLSEVVVDVKRLQEIVEPGHHCSHYHVFLNLLRRLLSTWLALYLSPPVGTEGWITKRCWML